MSCSVIVARTRIWRTMVPTIRGENFGGAAWQRAHLERKRFSPARRMVSSCALLVPVTEVAGASLPLVLSLPDLPLPPLVAAVAAIVSSRANTSSTPTTADLVFITSSLLAPVETQTDTSCRSSRDWRFCRQRTAGHNYWKFSRHCASSSSGQNPLG